MAPDTKRIAAIRQRYEATAKGMWWVQDYSFYNGYVVYSGQKDRPDLGMMVCENLTSKMSEAKWYKLSKDRREQEMLKEQTLNANIAFITSAHNEDIPWLLSMVERSRVVREEKGNNILTLRQFLARVCLFLFVGLIAIGVIHYYPTIQFVRIVVYFLASILSILVPPGIILLLLQLWKTATK